MTSVSPFVFYVTLSVIIINQLQSSSSNLLNNIKDMVQAPDYTFLIKSLPVSHYRNCIVMANTQFKGAADFLRNNFSSFMFSSQVPIRIMNEYIKEFRDKSSKLEYVHIFTEEFEDILKTLNTFVQRPQVAFSLPKYFIYVTSSKNPAIETLKSTMQLIWNNMRILHYIIVFTQHKDAAFSYNPFKKELKVVTQQQTRIFPTKVTDLNGYKIKLSIVLGEPSEGELVDNKCIKGNLCNLVNCFLNYLNASYEMPILDGGIEKLYRSSKQALKNREIDLSVGSHWLLKEYLMYSSFPIQQSAVVGVVRKSRPKPLFSSIFSFFDPYVWVLIVFFNIFFTILLNSGVHNFLKNYINGSQKLTTFNIIVLSHHVFEIVFETAFQGAVITALTTPVFEKNIDTVKDLVESGLPVYGEDDWSSLVTGKIELKQMSYIEVGTNLWAMKTDKVYLTTDYWAELQLLNKTVDGTYYSQFYHIIKEPLGMGKITFLLARNFPFQQTFNDIVIKMHDHGLFLWFGKRKFTFKDERLFQKLSFKNIYGAFVLLVMGLSISTLIFFIEIVWFNKVY